MDSLNFDDIRTEYYNLFNVALVKNDISILEEKYKSFNVPERDLKSPLDQVFRDVTLELLGEGDVEKLQCCVKFCIEACRKGITTPTMPVVLLGDIFDLLTLNKCEIMFTFVEDGLGIWKDDLFFTSCRNNLLRMCNDLLRRLSRTQNTVFCGRILLFLAKFFPFSERSGLNIVSEFNLENITEYGTESSTSLKETIAELDNGNAEKKFTIDYNLYCKFWSLQDFFRNPNQCYSKVLWKTFASHAGTVLTAFNNYKVEDIQRNEGSHVENRDGKQSEIYFAKFLTNQNLLELQLSDTNFRRCILIQFLILFQYLTSSVKFKSDKFQLHAEQAEWVKKMTDKVYSLLTETPPNGELFAKTVKHLFLREEHWNAWKNDGCPEFKKPKLENDSESFEKKVKTRTKDGSKLIGNIIREATANNTYCMGSAELTKLWNLCPDNLEACRSKKRDFLPSFETYFSEAIEQLDQSAMVEEQYKKVNESNFGWRALRLLSRNSPHFFAHNNKPITKLPDYLEVMIRKVAKDKQDRINNVQEGQESNQPESMEEEILKAEEDQEAHNEDDATGDTNDEKSSVQTNTTITQAQLEIICSKLGENWKKLATKLGYDSSEIQYFDEASGTVEERAINMLKRWFEDDEDATIENLLYIIEGLGFTEISDLVKNEESS